MHPSPELSVRYNVNIGCQHANDRVWIDHGKVWGATLCNE